MPAIEDMLRAELTEAQYAAAVDPSPEVLGLACAGSGKSRTLAYRIAWLLAGATSGVDHRVRVYGESGRSDQASDRGLWSRRG